MLDRACPLLSFRKDKQQTAELNLGLFVFVDAPVSPHPRLNPAKEKNSEANKQCLLKANDRQSIEPAPFQ